MEHNAALVVLDIDLPGFSENRALDSAEMSGYPGAEFMPVLAGRLAESGIEMVTADVFLGDAGLRGRAGVILSNEQTRYTRELLEHEGLRASACFSGESPIVAWRFYRRLREISRTYDHLFLFRGAHALAEGPAETHDFNWPCPTLTPLVGQPWAQRRHLTLINSNKRAFGWPRPLLDVRRPKQSLGRLLRSAENEGARAINPWMRSELYVDRLSAIKHFSRNPGFDLYGRGWRGPVVGADRELTEAIAQAYRGELGSHEKLEMLGRYRFSLCFENCSFPGYITEKIFDCMLAGAIPVYLGAPDIEEHIPAGTFLDMRRFAGFTELDEYLNAMSADEAAVLVEAARTFLRSDAANAFHMNSLVAELNDALIESLRRT